MQLRNFVNKKFITSERGQEVMKIIRQSDLTTRERSEELVALLDINHLVTKEDVQELRNVAANQLGALQVLREDIKEKIVQFGKTDHFFEHDRRVISVTADYSKLVKFLEELAEEMSTKKTSLERIRKFEQFHGELLREQEELQSWIEEFRSLDPIRDIQHYHQELEQYGSRLGRLKQLNEGHLPKVENILDELGVRDAHKEKRYILNLLDRFGVSYDKSQEMTFYTPGVGTKRGTIVQPQNRSRVENSKDDIIGAFFDYFSKKWGVPNRLSAVPSKDGASLCIYDHTMSMTMVISNEYGHATHIYPKIVPLHKLKDRSRDELKELFGGKQVNFNEFSGVAGWKERVDSTMKELFGDNKKNNSKQEIPPSQSSPVDEEVLEAVKNVEKPQTLQETPTSAIKKARELIHDESIDEIRRMNLARQLREYYYGFLSKVTEDMVKPGATFTGYVSGSNEKKIFVVIGGNEDDNIFGHLMKDGIPDSIDEKYRVCQVKVRKIYETTGHIEFELA